MGKKHSVKQGDTLVGLAYQNGFRDWRSIWDHPDNQALREKRANPQVLFEGDEVFIPDKIPRTEVCTTHQTHRFVLRSAPAYLRIFLRDDDGEALAEHRYSLSVGDLLFEGKSGTDGLVHHRIPSDAESAELTVWLDPEDEEHKHTWTLEVGHLDPIDTVAGVQARLNNLGFHAGEVTGSANDHTTAAIKQFQESVGLPPTGELDEAGRRALRDQHEGL